MPTLGWVEHQIAVCSSKLAYTKKSSALSAASRTQDIARDRPRLGIYRCPVCWQYHLTHKGGEMQAGAPARQMRQYEQRKGDRH